MHVCAYLAIAEWDYANFELHVVFIYFVRAFSPSSRISSRSTVVV